METKKIYARITSNGAILSCSFRIQTETVLTVEFAKELFSAKTVLKLQDTDPMTEAEKILGLNRQNISACCLGKSKTAYGYEWKYVE